MCAHILTHTNNKVDKQQGIEDPDPKLLLQSGEVGREAGLPSICSLGLERHGTPGSLALCCTSGLPTSSCLYLAYLIEHYVTRKAARR